MATCGTEVLRPSGHGQTESSGTTGVSGAMEVAKPSGAINPKLGTSQEDAEVNLDHRAGGDAL